MSKKTPGLFFALIITTLFFTVSANAQDKSENTLRKIFKLVPAEYFSIYCCDENPDEFIKKYVTVEDTATGYMQGADTEEDPQYSSFQMKLFKRSDGSYIVGFHSESMRWSDYYFLDYRNGKLKNISLTIPQYSTENIYEFPRNGTVIKVYKKKYDLPGEPLGVDNSVTKGKKLYDLVWANGKFTVKKKK